MGVILAVNDVNLRLPPSAHKHACSTSATASLLIKRFSLDPENVLRQNHSHKSHIKHMFCILRHVHASQELQETIFEEHSGFKTTLVPCSYKNVYGFC